MSIALAHHWLVGMRGGEKVLEEIGRLFPEAPIHTLVAERAKLSPSLQAHRVVESPLAFIPRASRHYKKMLPLFPRAFGALQVNGATEFLLTSDASVAKGLRCDSQIPHVCYCHSPPRYLWDMQDTYLQHTAGLNGVGRALFKSVTPSVRRFDYEAAQRVTHFIANSRFVQQRIRECYGRASTVIHPPVAVDEFRSDIPSEDFYLVVSELVPYKRIDLAVDAFNLLGSKLVIIGAGSELKSLQARARPNISFLGRQPFAVLKDHFQRCRAFVFPGVEDFGITPLEAQAAGRPVIALAQGGALETVIDGSTGSFFHEQTPAALAGAIAKFAEQRFEPAACRANAEKFSALRFRTEMKAFLEEKVPELFRGYSWPC